LERVVVDMNNRSMEEQIFKVLMILSVVIVIGGILSVIAVVFLKGISAISLSMLLESPHGGYYLGQGGGILNAITGSLLLAGCAVILSLLIALPVVMYLHSSTKGSWSASSIRTSLDIATGVPTIVYGAVIFMVMIFIGARSSLFWGMISVTLFILPIMIRSMDEIMIHVPKKIITAAFALGSTRTEMIHVVLRQSIPGILTAVLLAFGRGIGDAASVLFTAGYTDSLPASLFEPVATLPLAILFQINSPYPVVQDRAYAAGLVLLVIVLLVSLASRVLSQKFMKYVVK
jgi:phosphate transport system permease protein